ncbi:methyltransferase domain-containing protein [Xylariaceae sp. FL1651]|nr:methyltransferase domain-containing protein [Xylariaceae sp. FL1651]
MAASATTKRTFADEDGPYHLPNDTPEHERLDAQHRAFAEVMGGKIFHAPTSKLFFPNAPSRPRKILDIGCGTGVFTVQLGRLFPDAQVLGVDLSPVPTSRHGQLPNVTYLTGAPIADLLARGALQRGSFDYVFSRLVLLGIVGWPAHLRDVVMALLAPGGCAELHEYDAMIRSARAGGAELGGDWAWFRLWMEDTLAMGLDMRIGAHFKQLLLDAGADDVVENVYDIPHAGPPSAQQQGGAANNEDYWTTVVETYWSVVAKNAEGRRSAAELKEMRESFDKTFVANLRDLMCRMHVVVAHKPENQSDNY